MTPEFKKALLTEVDQKDWRPIYREFDGKRIRTDQEWAEVCFIPNAISHRLDAASLSVPCDPEPLVVDF